MSKDELLAESDFLSIHVPLSEATRHSIGEAELHRMKSSAILVNTARGPIVDEAALARALNERWIAGAGLDVLEREPQIDPTLLECSNAVLAPYWFCEHRYAPENDDHGGGTAWRASRATPSHLLNPAVWDSWAFRPADAK